MLIRIPRSFHLYFRVQSCCFSPVLVLGVDIFALQFVTFQRPLFGSSLALGSELLGELRNSSKENFAAACLPQLKRLNSA